jgi:superfamily II DNA or RNA helicase
MKLILPAVFAVDEIRAGNRIRQIAEPATGVDGTIVGFTRDRIEGFLFTAATDGIETLIIAKSKTIPPLILRAVVGAVDLNAANADLSTARWLQHPVLTAMAGRPFDYRRTLDDIRMSWISAFSYAQEDPAHNRKGLRLPQIGAIHAIHAHWTVSHEPATIVMPTGTGKTEAMLSVLVSAQCAKVLVLVPTDALRSQIADKFLTLGVLKEPDFQLVDERARRPIVGVLQHIPNDVAGVDDVFGRCNVVVTTSSIAGQCGAAVRERMAAHCSHLFIDEAHHAEAPTWRAFKRTFKDLKVLQFTATPFREDGQPLDGKFIFTYPLRKAQEEEYFKPIRFRRVVEFDQRRADEAIARAAIEQLRADAAKGHILMARTENVERAKQVFEIYERYPEFKPVQLHTGIKSVKQRAEIRRQIIEKESRIVVCVDMLGEGFDLPELKIAAFHDIRKTLAVTLQLAGRFTRSRPDLGDATFIANTADVRVHDELRKLYSRDPDWNLLLPDLSDRMIGEQMSLQEFLRGFTPISQGIPLKAVRPAMSTVVYRTTCTEWAPQRFRDGVLGIDTYEQFHETVNEEKHTLIVVMGRRTPLPWGDVGSLFDWVWDLYVVVWSPEQNLLFINSSGNAGEYAGVAKSIAGDDATLISGQEVFRAFAGVSRLRYQNIGLSEQLGRNVRYTGRMGGDVEPALTDLLRGRGSKTVLSGTGFENGQLVALGASRKGRIWSHERGRVDELAKWCKSVGAKLLNTNLNPDEVVKGTLSVKMVTSRPASMPIGVDWPEEVYTQPEAVFSLIVDGSSWPMSELDIGLAAPSVDGPLRFTIASEAEDVIFDLELFGTGEAPDYRFVKQGDRMVEVAHAGRVRPATEFFFYNPPVFWFADGSSLAGNQYAMLRNTLPQYDSAKIGTLDWHGINLRNESQGPQKDASSIQARVIADLKLKNFLVLFDDDGKGEAADIVAIRSVNEDAEPSAIEVELYHCKFSRGDAPGRRAEDLYQLCGQAQKSIAWASSSDKKTDLFTHLLRRESSRTQRNQASRLEVGTTEDLLTLRDMSRLLPVTVKIFIVQPGLRKQNPSPEQLGLLSVTENYLWETYQLPLRVIASE